MQPLFDLLQARVLAHNSNTTTANKALLDTLIERELKLLTGDRATVHAIRPDVPPSIPS